MRPKLTCTEEPIGVWGFQGVVNLNSLWGQISVEQGRHRSRVRTQAGKFSRVPSITVTPFTALGSRPCSQFLRGRYTSLSEPGLLSLRKEIRFFPGVAAVRPLGGKDVFTRKLAVRKDCLHAENSIKPRFYFSCTSKPTDRLGISSDGNVRGKEDREARGRKEGTKAAEKY